MTKLLSALIAAMFAVVTLTPVAYAADDKKDEKSMEKKDSKKKDKKDDKKEAEKK